MSWQWKHFYSVAQLLLVSLGQTAEQSGMPSLLSRSLYFIKKTDVRLMWLWPRHKGGTYTEAASKDAAACSSVQRYPNWIWIWSRMVRVLWPLTSCLELHMCTRVPYRGLLKWWAWMWLLMASKSFLDFFQPDSFSLQTGIQAADISTCYQLPHSNQDFPRVQTEDDSDSPNSSWRPQQLWNIPDLLLKVYDFWSHFEGRVANCIKTFSVRTFETCPMAFVLLNPSLGWEWVKFNRVLISSREKLTLSLRLPLIPIGVTLSILSDPGITPLLSTQKYQEHIWGSCNVLGEICAPWCHQIHVVSRLLVFCDFPVCSVIWIH